MMKKIILYGMTIFLLLNTNIVLATELKEGTGQWVDVSLDDTKLFDKNCEYRADLALNWADEVAPKNGRFYATAIEDNIIHFPLKRVLSGTAYGLLIGVGANNKRGNKTSGYVITVNKIEKRCPINPQLFLTPKSLKSLVGLFANGICPEGWTKTKWPYRKPIEGCSGKSCKMVGVKELPGYIACEKK